MGMNVVKSNFEWDFNKNILNFGDINRIIAKDLTHSKSEDRYYCFGSVNDEIITVRFTFRKNIIRIIGAGYWRKGKQIYEKENKVHE
jgi:uncharacterized protein